jgi:putative ATP-dependent endonuclease of the OLD family
LADIDVILSKKALIVGENKSGKTNFIHALRLILDPDLPDSYRQLKEEDFFDELEDPMEMGVEIEISIDLKGFENNESLLSIISDYIVDNGASPTARITYKFAPMIDLSKDKGNDQPEYKYDFIIYGGDDPSNIFGYQQRKWMPLQVLPALRDAETDLRSLRRSPLRPLVDRINIKKEQLESAAKKVDDATKEILSLKGIYALSENIEDRLEDMIGELHSVSPSLGIASTDALRLLRSLKLFVDGTKNREIGDTSLGICNILYLTLLLLELEHKEVEGERATTILCIEEPEAHLHPHLQRLVYRDFLSRDSSVILTTHSPHIASVSPIQSIVLLRDNSKNASIATSTANVNFSKQQYKDLERYLDATRGEILFARGVILVEGYAELYIIPAIADVLNLPLDERGISVCSVHGIDFVPYVRLLGKNSLNIPFIIITDGDPTEKDEKIIYRGHIRGINIVKELLPKIVPDLLKLVKNEDWNVLDSRLEKLGVFVGEDTLEIDLADSGNTEEMIETLEELGAGTKKLDKFSKSLSDTDKEKNSSYIISKIEEFGKGRYAQRLSSKLKKSNIPEYIEKAIKHIAKII